MSLSFGSFASTAVSTFKGLAVAAAGTEARPAGDAATQARPAGQDAAAPAAPAASAPAAASTPIVPAPVATAAERNEPKAAKGRRLGSVLDAYA